MMRCTPCTLPPHSARVISLIGTSTSAPQSGPSTVPTPPSTGITTICTEKSRLIVRVGVMKPTS